jgi:ATP-dependent exoDNAse (exonuclease V) beta subunit
MCPVQPVTCVYRPFTHLSHTAKGLEFPVVVVPDLGRGPGRGLRHVLLDRARGTFAAQVGRVGTRSFPFRRRTTRT